MSPIIKFILFVASLPLCFAYNFPYEATQLTDFDVANNSDIAFGKLPARPLAKCKTFPGDSSWPSLSRWTAFNNSLDGALVKGIPPAAACYKGQYEDAAKCEVARQGARSSNFMYAVAPEEIVGLLWLTLIGSKEDPVIPTEQWTLGNPCPIPNANETPALEAACNISSYPAYAVVASTIKHVQLAVNFARNNNIRLTIKYVEYTSMLSIARRSPSTETQATTSSVETPAAVHYKSTSTTSKLSNTYLQSKSRSTREKLHGSVRPWSSTILCATRESTMSPF
jgi:hypothetical protein